MGQWGHPLIKAILVKGWGQAWLIGLFYHGRMFNTAAQKYYYPVPKFDLSEKDVRGFINELRGFHGQFGELERKSIEPIALALENGNVRAMQRFVSAAEWNDEKIMFKYRSMVNDDLSSPDGALIFSVTCPMILWMAPSHINVPISTFFSLAPENQDGKIPLGSHFY